MKDIAEQEVIDLDDMDVEAFNAFRSAMNEKIFAAGNLTTNRFFNLDTRAYEAGALDVKSKEMLGLVASLVLVGPLLAMGALFRQRDVEARSQALRFELERSELSRQALEARMRLLRAQVQPHFLFNTLANVQALVESGSPRAGPVLQTLTEYLRAAMPGLHDAQPTLGDELARVRAYLSLMEMRMPDRLRWQVQADPALAGLRFPPMALLTLVENAVRHGIDPSEEGGEVQVLASARPDGGLQLTVQDSGVGMADGAPAPASRGTGLANLRARLQAMYGDAARLTLTEPPPHGVRAEIRLPPPDARSGMTPST